MALGIPMALLASGAISAGGGILGGLLSKQKNINPEDLLIYKQLPDYPESESARKMWGETLQRWSTMPGFGAISPDWGDIWDRARKKISQYYWGGTMDTGLAGKIRASAAKRGVSQSPALENMLLTMGFEEGGKMKDLSSEIAEREATLGEEGRRNWLQSLMNLSGLKPDFVKGTGGGTQSTTYGPGNMIGDISGGIGGLFGQYAQNKQQEKMLQDYLAGLKGIYTPETPSTISSWFGSARPQLKYSELPESLRYEMR